MRETEMVSIGFFEYWERDKVYDRLSCTELIATNARTLFEETSCTKVNKISLGNICHSIICFQKAGRAIIHQQVGTR